jgi:poly(hydroxyalkanoate) depolymerase family esterase
MRGAAGGRCGRRALAAQPRMGVSRLDTGHVGWSRLVFFLPRLGCPGTRCSSTGTPTCGSVTTSQGGGRRMSRRGRTRRRGWIRRALGDQVPGFGLGSGAWSGAGPELLRDRAMRRRPLWIAVAGACGAAVGIAAVIAATIAPSPSASSVSSPLSAPSPSPSLSPGGERGYQHGSVSERGDVYPYAVYVPSSLRAGSAAPLMVVLHGCDTTADQMATASQYDALAERDRFIVLYPDVDTLDASTYGRCWRGIWEPDLEGRGVGDASAIADMTRGVLRRWHADPGRVYAIGISAGGFETAILAAYYPDMYAAIGIHSGAPYMGAEPGCLPAGASAADTAKLAGNALDAMGPRARVMPVIVIHGDVDPSVPYRCGRQVIAQWLGVDNVILQRGHRPGVPGRPAGSRDAVVPGGHGYTVLSYADRSGCVVAQLWTVHGMGHYWSGGSAGPASVPYSDPRGPSAAAASWAFFSRWRLSGPLRPCSRAG